MDECADAPFCLIVQQTVDSTEQREGGRRRKRSKRRPCQGGGHLRGQDGEGEDDLLKCVFIILT